MKWSEKLKGQANPVISFLDGQKDEYLSAANLYVMMNDQLKKWRRAGVKSGDQVELAPNGKEFIVQLLTARVGEQFAVMASSDGSGVSTAPEAAGRSGICFRSSGTQRGRWIFLPWTHIDRQVEAHAEKLAHLRHTTRISILPKSHVFGLVIDLLVGLYLQQTILISFESYSSALWRKAIRQIDLEESVFMCLTPRLLHLILKNPQNKNRLQNFNVMMGGASTPQWLLAQAEKSLAGYTEGYGLTEAGPGVLFEGRPLDFVEVQLKPISTTTAISASVGEQTEWRELLVKSPTMGQFDSDPDDWHGDFFRTRDLAVETADGKIKVIGRIGDRIKNIAGQWKALADVENDLQKKLALEWIAIGNRNGCVEVVIGDQDQEKKETLMGLLKELFGDLIDIKILPQSINIEAIRVKDFRSAILNIGDLYVPSAS